MVFALKVNGFSFSGTVKKIVDGLEQLNRPSFNFSHDNLPPPPEYPKWLDKSPPGRGKLNLEKVNLSKSQPDLSTVGLIKNGINFNGFKRGTSAPRPKTKGREEFDCTSEEMVDILMKENGALKMEIDQCYQKVAKAQKVRFIDVNTCHIFIVFV